MKKALTLIIKLAPFMIAMSISFFYRQAIFSYLVSEFNQPISLLRDMQQLSH